MSLKDIPPSINSTDALMGLPAHLDTFQLAPAATTTEFFAEHSGTAEASQPVSSSQRAFKKAVAAISKDMPILMHGSGDVVPDQVNPDTVQLLSELTVRYIANLVDAAVDAQELLAGGKPITPPPPRYPRSRQPALPNVPDDDKKKSAEEESKGKGSVASLLKKRPRRPDVDYWDEPLPEPKIVKRSSAEASSPFSASKQRGLEEEDKDKPVHVDQWVGVAGVDLWEQSRSRKAYVQMPDVVGVKNFLFPICHDGFLYGKVRQIQATRRQIAPLLVDSVVMKEVQTEGALARKPRRRKKVDFSKESGDADVEEEPEQEEEEDNEDNEPMWPGLDFLLPVHAITEDSITF